jgi:hypothetical protein
MNLLIIGTSDTGKTHYSGQLLGRLNTRESRLKLDAAPQDLTPYEDVLDCLNEGRTAAHTASGAYHQTPLQVCDEQNRKAVLEWSDYAGEQIKQMVQARSTDAHWLEKLTTSDGWLFFVRLGNVEKREDLISRPPGQSLGLTKASEIATETQTAEPESSFSSVAQHIELLQVLLAMSGRGSLKKLDKPNLLVLLSCWDELVRGGEASDGDLPADVLRRRMPMLSEFIGSNWHKETFTVYGLSSLEKTLDSKNSDDEFRNLGPENFGFVIEPDGTKNSDLTLPVAALLELTKR